VERNGQLALERVHDFVLVHAEHGYTTNLPLAGVTDGQAWVAYRFEGEDLEPEHGGPARLLVPHLYFWKSAKWVRGLRLSDEDEPALWRRDYTDEIDQWIELGQPDGEARFVGLGADGHTTDDGCDQPHGGE